MSCFWHIQNFCHFLLHPTGDILYILFIAVMEEQLHDTSNYLLLLCAYFFVNGLSCIYVCSLCKFYSEVILPIKAYVLYFLYDINGYQFYCDILRYGWPLSLDEL